MVLSPGRLTRQRAQTQLGKTEGKPAAVPKRAAAKENAAPKRRSSARLQEKLSQQQQSKDEDDSEPMEVEAVPVNTVVAAAQDTAMEVRGI